MPVIRRKATHKKMDTQFTLFATTAEGTEDVLAGEIKGLGASHIEIHRRGVSFQGDLALCYRANLWLRTAHRVLIQLARFPAPDREALYDGVREIFWNEHVSKLGTLAIDAVAAGSKLSHTRFIAQVVKDAIVDGFRDRTGRRPSVDNKDPDLRINARLSKNHCTLSLDTSGERLHRRGYRPAFGMDAPLKETLAAAVLFKAGYTGQSLLLDPMCGSGTFLVEGALIAKNIAPGLLGRSFGFMRHPTFDRKLWKELTEEAKHLVREDTAFPILGSDVASEAIRAVKTSCQGAGVDDVIRIRRASFSDLQSREKGTLVTNPPYGERLGEMSRLASLYGEFGDVLKNQCCGMSAHILTSSKFLAGKIGLRAHKRDILWNGPIECRLLHYKLY